MAIKETKTIKAKIEQDVTVNASVITEMNFNLTEQKATLTIQTGNIDDAGNFQPVGDVETHEIKDALEHNEEKEETLTVDAQKHITTSSPIVRLSSVKQGSIIMRKDRSYKQLNDTDIQLFDSQPGDKVTVNYIHLAPPITDFTDTFFGGTGESLDKKNQLAIWGKLQEKGLITGTIVDSGKFL